MGVTAAGADAVRIAAGRAADFQLNKFRIIDTPDGSVGVVRTKDGFFAVLNRCPHQGAQVCVGTDVTCTTVPSPPFEYQLGHEHAVVRCPLHRWEFRVDTGENIGRVTRGRLRTFPVELEADVVYVRGSGYASADREP